MTESLPSLRRKRSGTEKSANSNATRQTPLTGLSRTTGRNFRNSLTNWERNNESQIEFLKKRNEEIVSKLKKFEITEENNDG